jgi:hypothetical protein
LSQLWWINLNPLRGSAKSQTAPQRTVFMDMQRTHYWRPAHATGFTAPQGATCTHQPLLMHQSCSCWSSIGIDDLVTEAGLAPNLHDNDVLSIDDLTHDTVSICADGHSRFLKGNDYDDRNRKIL